MLLILGTLLPFFLSALWGGVPMISAHIAHWTHWMVLPTKRKKYRCHQFPSAIRQWGRYIDSYHLENMSDNWLGTIPSHSRYNWSVHSCQFFPCACSWSQGLHHQGSDILSVYDTYVITTVNISKICSAVQCSEVKWRMINEAKKKGKDNWKKIEDYVKEQEE